MDVTIPAHLSKRLQKLAEKQQRPVQMILEDRLFTALDDELEQLPTSEEAELRALHYLSDDALRAIAAEQMSAVNQATIADLMPRHKRGELTAEEENQLLALVERGDQLMLRKAEAAALLVQRGYSGVKMGKDE